MKTNKTWKMVNLPAGKAGGKWKMWGLLSGLLSIFIPSPFAGDGGGFLFAQNSQVTWSSFNGGFGVSSSENSIITSSAGIPFVGSTANGSSSIISGFLTNYSLIITDVNDKQEIIPTVYKLNQNFPNPFNPSTIINYQVPQEGFVTLKVYDILGNEISTLVNEVKNAGNYKVPFNANKLASGVYIYQLTTGAFVDTKKMILLR